MSTAGDSYFTRLSSRLQGNSEDVLTVSLAGNTAWEGDTVDTNTHGGAGCTSAGDEPLREQLLQHQPSFQLLASVEVVELSCLAAGKHSSQKAPGETTASSTSTTSDDQPCVLLSREPTEDSATWRSVLDHLTSSGLAGELGSGEVTHDSLATYSSELMYASIASCLGPVWVSCVGIDLVTLPAQLCLEPLA
jgi:hypothetical protein